MIKWSKKEATRHLTELKNPFEEVLLKGQPQGKSRILIEQMKRMARKGQMPKPERMMETR